jgi:hypothetical protein
MADKAQVKFTRDVRKRAYEAGIHGCEFCGGWAVYTLSHHIIPRKYKSTYSGNIDDISNGIVLCPNHAAVADDMAGTHDNSHKPFSEYTGPRTKDELLEKLRLWEQKHMNGGFASKMSATQI